MYYLFTGDLEVYPYQGYNKIDLEYASDYVQEFGSEKLHDQLESTYRHDDKEQLSFDKILVELPVDYLEYGEFNNDELIEALYDHVVLDDCILYHIKGIEELELSDGYTIEACPEDQVRRLNGESELFNTDDNGAIVYSAPLLEATIQTSEVVEDDKESKEMDVNKTVELLNKFYDTRSNSTYDAAQIFTEIKASESFKPEFKSFNKLAEATKWSRQTVHSLVKIMGIEGLNNRETFVTLGFGTVDKLAKAHGKLDESDFNAVLNFALTPDDNDKLPTQKSVCEAIKNAGEEVDPDVQDPNSKTLADWQKEKSSLITEKKDIEDRLAQILIELSEAEEAIQELAK